MRELVAIITIVITLFTISNIAYGIELGSEVLLDVQKDPEISNLLDGPFFTNQFNNSLQTENLTFQTEETITRYLELPKYSNVKSANLSLNGYKNIIPEIDNQEIGSSLTPLYNGNKIRWAQRKNITGRAVKSLEFYIGKGATNEAPGLPTGNVTFVIRRVSDDSIIVSKVWGDAADLNPSWFFAVGNLWLPNATWEGVIFDDLVIIDEEVRLSLEFSGGDSANSVLIWYRTANLKPNEYTSGYRTSWFESTGSDTAYKSTYDLSYPYNPSIGISEPDVWNYTGIFNQKNVKTDDLSSTLNIALNNGSCDCAGCTLNGDVCAIPFSFYSNTAGILEYSELNVHYDVQEPPPSIPTVLLCNGNNCSNNETFFESLEIACFGSTDPEGDLITYQIDAFYNHENPLQISITTFNNSLESENITITGNILFENKFSNGLSTETLVFTQNENIIRYLDLPKFSDVKASNLTITGHDPSLNWVEDPSKVSGITGGGLQAYPETFFLNGQHHLIIGYQGGSLDGYTWNGNGWTLNSTILNGISIPSDTDHHHVSPTVFKMGNNLHLILGFQGGSFDGYTWTGSSWTSNNTIVSGLAPVTLSFNRPEGFHTGNTLYLIVPRWSSGGVGPFIYDGYVWTGNIWSSDSTITSGLSGETAKISVFDKGSETYMIKGTGNSGGNPTGLNWSGSSWVSYSELVTGITSTGARYNTPTVFNLSSSNFGLVLMDEGSNKKGFDLQLEYGPTNPYLEVGTIDGNREWQSSGIYHDTSTTNDFTNQLNTALNGGSCDCSGCSLSGDICGIPFTFHSDSKGKLEYNNIFVYYDPEGTGAGKNELRYLRIPKDVNVISATMDVTNYNTNNPYIEIGTPDGNYEWNYSGQLPELIEISANSITRILQGGFEGDINNFMDGDQSTFYEIDGSSTGVMVKFSEMNYTIQEENPENLKWHINWSSFGGSGVFTDQRPNCDGDTGGLYNIACYYNWSSGNLSVMWFHWSSPNEGHIEKQIQPDGVTENGDISVTTARFFTGTNTIIHYYETWVSYQKSKFPVNDFSTELNSALNNCDCVGCNLNGDYCEIPFTFHSDVPGDIMEYSNLNVTYELSTYWENIGNHSENSTFNWNISNITPQSDVDLRCRAIDLNGSVSYSEYYQPGVNITIIDQFPPVLDPLSNVTVDENETVVIDVNATDANLDVLTYYTNAIDVLPSSSSFDSVTGLFIWIPEFYDAGEYYVTFNVTDGISWDNETITITVISNTQPGENVSINLTECSLNVTFDNVTTSGTTLCETSSSGPAPPGGFQIIPSGAPIYYILNSTANFTGNVTVCFEYNDTDVMGPESNLKLRHFDGGWIDITIQPVDTVNNIICGETDSFSYFAVMEQSYICGDMNEDESVNIIDLTYMVDWMFRGGLAPQPLESADMNGDGQLDISDLTYMVAWMFQGGSDPICGTTISSPQSLEFSDTELLEAETSLQEAGLDITLIEEGETIKLEPKLL